MCDGAEWQNAEANCNHVFVNEKDYYFLERNRIDAHTFDKLFLVGPNGANTHKIR